jgi:hypothetical protein
MAWATTMILAALLRQSTSPVMHLDFNATASYLADLSGNGFHALLHGETMHLIEGPRAGQKAILLRNGEWLEPPEARVLLGEESQRGGIALWVRPDFDPLALPQGTWEGWVVLIYFQKRSGNGLPDGYNEIGLALHGKELRAKVVGGQELAPFAVIPSPLRQGLWTHLAITWSPSERRLYVDGKLVAESRGNFPPTVLDDFPSAIGRHPPSGRWLFTGAIADVRVYREAPTPEDIAALVR